ncbi:MAG TPA: type II toxin-antitoxin system RelE/ParE family toxin [Stellaceae bacterium]|nr:type II toxin-antitoxin system RelE/ParE family toxin [Stellaceae bacterium]
MQTVIETPSYLADCRRAALSDEEMSDIVATISADSSAGDLIPGTGGARKLRFPGRGKGKSGGYRTVSFFGGEDVPVLLLALISKGERADLSQAERNELRKELAGYAADYRANVRKRMATSRRRGRR